MISIDNKCYLINLKKGMIDIDKAWNVVNRDKSVQNLWVKLVLCAAKAGAVVKGRTIIADSFIVDAGFIEEDEQALKRLAGYDFLTYNKQSPAAKPRVKTIPTPSAPSPLDDLGKANKGVVDFISFDVLSNFEDFWTKYPPRQGAKQRKAEAKSWYISHVNESEKASKLIQALENYKRSNAVITGYVKDAINWLSDWEAWVDFDPANQSTGGRRPTQAQINRADDDRVIL